MTIRNKTQYAYAAIAVLVSALLTLTGCDPMASLGESMKVMPDTPTNVSISAKTSDGFTVSWSPAQKADSYTVYYSTGSSPNNATRQTTASTSYTVTGLSPDTSYNVWVTAHNSRGDSKASDVTQAKTTYESLPSAPIGVTATANGATSVTVSWNAESMAADYYVYYGTTSYDTPNQAGIVTSPSTSYTVTGLNSGTRYYFWVKSHNGVGFSSLSSYATATTTNGIIELTSSNTTWTLGYISSSQTTVYYTMKMTGNIWYDIYWRDNNYLSQYARIKVSAYSSSKVFFSDLSGDYSTTARRITPTTTGYVTIAVTQYNSLSSGYFYIRVY